MMSVREKMSVSLYDDITNVIVIMIGLVAVEMTKQAMRTASAVAMSVARQHDDIDHGRAWLVLVGVSCGVVIYCSTMYMGGVIYVALLETFKEGYTKTSLVGSVNIGVMCFAAPLAGIVMNKFDSRVVMIAGGVLSGVGLAASAFVESVNSVILTAGVLVGLGYSCSSAGLCVALGFYFRRWRNHTISLYYVLVAVAIFTSAPFGGHIIEEYGIRSAFLIMASVNLQICIIGMFCKPSSVEKQIHTQRQLSLDKDKYKRNKLKTEENSSKVLFNISIMKNIPFICFLISTSSWNFALTVAIMHLPNYVFINSGDSDEINLIMTLFSIGHLTGRIIGCLTVSFKEELSLYVHLGSLGIGGALTAAFPVYSQHKAGNFAFSVLLGLSCGAPSSMATVLATMFVGVAMLPEAYSLVYFFGGIGVTTGPVIAGYLYSSTKSYVFSFVTAGGVLLLGSLASIAAAIFKSRLKPLEDNIHVHDIGDKEFEVSNKADELTGLIIKDTGLLKEEQETSTLLD